jgi:hypothetical protein
VDVELRFNWARVGHLSEMTVKQQLVLADRLIALALGLGCFRYQSLRRVYYVPVNMRVGRKRSGLLHLPCAGQRPRTFRKLDSAI